MVYFQGSERYEMSDSKLIMELFLEQRKLRLPASCRGVGGRLKPLLLGIIVLTSNTEFLREYLSGSNASAQSQTLYYFTGKRKLRIAKHLQQRIGNKVSSQR